MKINKTIVTNQQINLGALEKKLTKNLNYMVKTRAERVLERAKGSVLNTLRRQAANNINVGTYPSQSSCDKERATKILSFCKELGIKNLKLEQRGEQSFQVVWRIVNF